MPKTTRRIFLAIYTIFFVLFASFLLLNSFGYRINPSKRAIEYSATISIKTAPIDARVSVDNTDHSARTPSDLTINEAGSIGLTITKDNYLPEKIAINYKGGENTSIFMDRMYLLPTRPSTTFSITGTIIAFVNQTTLLVSQNSVLSLQTVTAAGPVTSIPVISTLTIPNARLNFVAIGESAYYDNSAKLVLFNRDGKWRLINATTLLPLTKSVVATSSELLLLDTNNQIWTWDYRVLQPSFVDNDVQGIDFLESPRTIWIWKNNWIQRLEINAPLAGQIQPKNALITNNLLLGERNESFKIRAVYQGYIFQLGQKLFYRPDYELAQFIPLATNARLSGVANDSIYWINSNNELIFTNLRNLLRRSIATNLSNAITSLTYDEYWNRIMLYSDMTVSSIWHDNDRDNQAINTYPFNNWLILPCFPNSEQGSQICINSSSVELYTNRNFIL